MTLAYDYPLLGLFWSMLWFFLLFVWILALFHVFADIFRSHDMGGFAKAIWVIFVIFLPFLGVFVYLIARGDKMTEHAIASAQQQQQQFDAYVKQTASSASVADQLTQLAALRDAGTISPADYEAGKAKILA
jgi:hypothetical protein